jgi:hypothetical protein
MARRILFLLPALVLFCCADIAQAEPGTQRSGNWLTRWLPSWGKPKATPPTSEEVNVPGAALNPVPARPDSALVRTKYFERLKICNKLRAVALQTGDDELLRQAEQLEIRSWDAYQAQLKRLSQNPSAVSPEDDIGRHVSSGTSAPRTGPSATPPNPGASARRR